MDCSRDTLCVCVCVLHWFVCDMLADVSVQPKWIFAVGIQHQAKAVECTPSIGNYKGHQSVCYDSAFWFNRQVMQVFH